MGRWPAFLDPNSQPFLISLAHWSSIHGKQSVDENIIMGEWPATESFRTSEKKRTSKLLKIYGQLFLIVTLNPN